VATELADLGSSTLLVDADSYGGVIAQLLGLLDEAPGLAAACRAANAGALDVPALASLARGLSPTLRVLTGISRADRWPELRPAALEVVLAAARSLSAVTVVDCGFSLEQDEELVYDVAAPRRNGATTAALEAADVVLAVGSADPVGLQRLVRGLSDLRDLVPGAEVRVVINRVRRGPTGPGQPEPEIAAALERYAGVLNPWFVPLDIAGLDSALAAGRSLVEVAPDSSARHALRGLAASLVGVSLPDSGGRRRRRTASATG
jgi:MinD-like ATPase involved in chromosome partitioning or flagellar assembly